jgi:16S rRNA (adenine1518-N6/adenine1519-N6)-dimethyltransferase
MVDKPVFKVVANIPYYLSGLLFRRCLETSHQPSALVFLIQKELAERITGRVDDKRSIISHAVAVFGNVRYVTTIKRGHFTPSPNIDSAIIAVTDISCKQLGDLPAKSFFEFLHVAFAGKRKQLGGQLRRVYGVPVVDRALAAAAVDPTARAEDLSTSTLVCIATLIHKPQRGL